MAVSKITPQQAVRLLDAGKAVAVDVREADEFASGHIPGARLLPLDTIARDAAQILPQKQEPVLVYCRSGRRSATGAALLERMGYTNVRDLGGVMTWPYELEH